MASLAEIKSKIEGKTDAEINLMGNLPRGVYSAKIVKHRNDEAEGTTNDGREWVRWNTVVTLDVIEPVKVDETDWENYLELGNSATPRIEVEIDNLPGNRGSNLRRKELNDMRNALEAEDDVEWTEVLDNAINDESVIEFYYSSNVASNGNIYHNYRFQRPRG